MTCMKENTQFDLAMELLITNGFDGLTLVLFPFQLVDQIDHAVIAAPPAVSDAVGANGNGKVALPGAGAADSLCVTIHPIT